MPKKVSSLEHASMAMVHVDKKGVHLYATCTMQTCFVLSDISSLRTYGKRFDIKESLTDLRRRVGAKQSGAVHAIVVCGVVIRKDSALLQNCKLRAGWGSAHLPSNYQSIGKFIVKRKFDSENPDTMPSQSSHERADAVAAPHATIETEIDKPEENQESNATLSSSACVQTLATSLEEPSAKRLCTESPLDTPLQPGQGSHTDAYTSDSLTMTDHPNTHACNTPDETPVAQDDTSMEPVPAEATSQLIPIDATAVLVPHNDLLDEQPVADCGDGRDAQEHVDDTVDPKSSQDGPDGG